MCWEAPPGSEPSELFHLLLFRVRCVSLLSSRVVSRGVAQWSARQPSNHIAMKALATFGILLLLGATSGARAAENWYLRNSTDPRSGDLQGKSGISAPLQYCFRGIA